MNSDPSFEHAWHDRTLAHTERARLLAAAMTLEQKLGQLGSFWPRPQEDAELGGGDVAPMQSAFEAARRSFAAAVGSGLGHITRIFGSEVVSVAEGVRRAQRMQSELRARAPFGIPAIVHEECLTGFTAYGATVYPTPLAWGATFDPELIESMAHAIGEDLHAVGVHQGLSPLLDVVTDYRWGRVEETIGEDPYLVGILGTAYVRGLQSAGVVATLKHFAGYASSRAGRNHAPVAMGPRQFRDTVLAPFELAVREGHARSVMNSYSDIDGVPVAASAELLHDVLREEWGFTGTVVSDYWAIAFLDIMHRVAQDRAGSGALALRAGIDVELPDTDAYAQLAPLVGAGELDESFVDRALLRVLTQKAELGLLDADPVIVPDGGHERDLDSPGNRRIARRIAEESVVLLHNNGVLPLDQTSRRVAVVGPTASEARSLLGCYSFPNHILSRYDDQGTGIPVASLLDVLSAEPGMQIRYARGVDFTSDDSSGIAEAVAAAAGADLAIVTVGDIASLFGRGTSGEGCDAEDLQLPGIQGALVDAILDTGVPVVLVVVSGRPYALGPYLDRCAAVLQTFLPGSEGSAAIADVLTGRVNPSGRLPVSIPSHAGSQPATYLGPPLAQGSHGISNLDPTPARPFGFGLSYTTFALGALELDAAEMPTDGHVTATITVTNTGTKAGHHVVQLYLTDEVAQLAQPVRRLIGFQRVHLEPGQTRLVTFQVHAERTAFTGVDLLRIVEPGWFTLSAADDSASTGSTARLRIMGEIRTLRGPIVLTTPSRAE